jgi:fatty acid synthase subunit beta
MRLTCTILAFTDTTLKLLVEILGRHAGFFIEIVNYNVRNSQYVCAGDRRALDCLQRVLDMLNAANSSIPTPYSEETLNVITLERMKLYDGIAAPTIELHRGRATVPLAGLDVPFHSSKLQPMMEPFRRVLSEILEQGKIKPGQLVGKYVPNLTGKTFAIDRQYFEEVFKRTGSERLRDVLERWEDYWEPRIKAEGEEKGMSRC